jgi:hypothetical protein
MSIAVRNTQRAILLSAPAITTVLHHIRDIAGYKDW